MSKAHANGLRRTDTRRHSKDDALDNREFELLLEGCHNINDDYYALQAQFVVLVAGRLGLRSGEIAHLREDWIDWRRNMICIPRHEPCESGRDGAVCGTCKQHAQQRADHNPDVSYEQALAESWSAKTENAAREVPFDADPRAEIVIERFFERHNEWPQSQQAVNRRVARAAEAAAELDADDLYPHCLRATAASHWAAKDLDIFALKALMGWSELSTAQCYVTASGERTAQAIRDTT